MSVKVVSEKPVKLLRTTCKKCFYELEYTPIDVESQAVYSMGDYDDTYYYVRCPREVCNHLTRVKEPRID